MREPFVLACLLLLAFGVASPVLADAPAVARPRFEVGGKPGVVFFVPARSRVGVAAVGTAHNVALPSLADSGRVEFWLGASSRRVAAASRLLAPPGRPFWEPGATTDGDFLIYALSAEPRGITVLELAPDHRLQAGEKVRVLGIPSNRAGDEDDVGGRIDAISNQSFTVELDKPFDLRGWGGAPVLNKERQVIGMVQGRAPGGASGLVTAGKIGGVAKALANPLVKGSGERFSAFAEAIEERTQSAARPNRDGGQERAAKSRPPTLIRQARKENTRIHLNVEYPPEGATVSDSVCGTFVAGRALALQGELRRFDVVLVLDTSRSTADATGADINGNGIIGKSRLGRIGSMFDMGSTDPGDSILSAEVAAARQLLRGLDPRSTRVGVVTFAGMPPGTGGGFFSRGPPPPAVTIVPLTTEYAQVERSLDEVQARSPAGSTHMAAGVDQATIELLGLRGALSRSDPDSEKVVFFFTDGEPTLPYGPGHDADNVKAVLRAANRANRGEVRIHSFAIGPEALEGPLATREMADRTGGYFTPVRHPGDLINVVDQVSFANLDGIELKSRTTGNPAEPFRSTADGTWGGFVKMVPGVNQIEIHAVADDGTEATKVLKVTFEPEAPSPNLPEQMITQRTRLLEDCLRDIKRLRLEAEKEHAEEVRKSLLVEIEEERQKARERADEQRKKLQIEVGEDETGP